MIKKYTNTNCRRQPRGTARKSCSTVTRHQEDKLSKATSSLFPIKSFACLHSYMASTWQLAKKKRPIIFVMQSNIASKPSTWMPRYTTTENKQLTSLRAAEFVSLVYIQCKTNLEASEHAFSEKKLTFQVPSKYASRVFILTLAKLSTS